MIVEAQAGRVGPDSGRRRSRAGAAAARLVPLMRATPAADQTSVMNTGRSKNLILPDGRVLAYRERAGHGRPLVLVHGLFDCSAGWKTFIARTQRPVVAFDLPGMGDSERPTRPQISAYAEDLADGIDCLGVRDFTLVGHSLGGAVATSLAELMPDAVAALVLLAPSCFGRIAASELSSAPVVSQILRHALPLAMANPITATGIYMTMVGNGSTPDRELLGRLRSRAHRTMPGVQMAVKATAEAGRSEDAFFRRQVGFQGPVRALWGSKDLVVPRSHADGVLTAFPHARVSVWDGMGHHPQRERAADLPRFVESVLPEPRRTERRRRMALPHPLAILPAGGYGRLAEVA
jgi:pimeloyl-ACP methyl ester carboxylesterase